MKDRLKQLRKTLGLKQREIAERLGISVSNVGDWESGQREIPRARIYQICHEYRVRRAWLVDGVGEMFEPEPDPVDDEDAQRRFVAACFEELRPETQKIVLDAMRKYLIDAPTPPPDPAPVDAPPEILVADVPRDFDEINA